MTRRSAWSALADDWDPDNEAIARMRDALALQPTPEPVQDAPGPPEPVEVASEPAEPLPDPSRGRIADLVARVQAGDLSAVDLLRRLIDR
jgi:hypothetical protein